MMNKLKALVEKEDNIYEQMGNFSRDKNDMEMLRKNGDIKNGFDLAVDMAQLRKESVVLTCGQ